MTVTLYKKKGTYIDKQTQREKSFTNFYVRCGDQLIPVEPVYFPNPKCENRDPSYQGRKAVMEAFAEVLPDVKKSSSAQSNNVSGVQNPAPASNFEEVGTMDDLPF